MAMKHHSILLTLLSTTPKHEHTEFLPNPTGTPLPFEGLLLTGGQRSKSVCHLQNDELSHHRLAFTVSSGTEQLLPPGVP